jgi:hypothetical protein
MHSVDKLKRYEYLGGDKMNGKMTKEEYNRLEGIAVDAEALAVMAMSNKGFVERLMAQGVPAGCAITMLMSTNLDKSSGVTNMTDLSLKICAEADRLALIWLSHVAVGFDELSATQICCTI